VVNGSQRKFRFAEGVMGRSGTGARMLRETGFRKGGGGGFRKSDGGGWGWGSSGRVLSVPGSH